MVAAERRSGAMRRRNAARALALGVVSSLVLVLCAERAAAEGLHSKGEDAPGAQEMRDSTGKDVPSVLIQVLDRLVWVDMAPRTASSLGGPGHALVASEFQRVGEQVRGSRVDAGKGPQKTDSSVDTAEVRASLIAYSPLNGIPAGADRALVVRVISAVGIGAPDLRARLLQEYGPLARRSGSGVPWHSPRSIDEVDVEKESLPIRRLRAERAAGALAGLAVADALGSFLEFLPAWDTPSADFSFDKEKMAYSVKWRSYEASKNPNFQLKKGQWTDDASMAFCLADSLIAAVCNPSRDAVSRAVVSASDDSGSASESLSAAGHRSARVDPLFDARDLRARLFAWWHHGYLNAFRRDAERLSRLKSRGSVGIRGSIHRSLEAIEGARSVEDIPPEYETRDSKHADDAGNGSIVRLAPVAMRFSKNEHVAMEVAARQSLATHTSKKARDCARFLAFLLCRAIERPVPDGEAESRIGIQNFLLSVQREFLAQVEGGRIRDMDADVLKVVRAGEVFPGDSSTRAPGSARSDLSEKEAIWNWRSPTLRVSTTIEARWRSGPWYNEHYYVSREYFGAYALDALAIALHGCFWTSSFEEAVVKTVNHLGDAGSTGAVAGQIAGAFYGFGAIPEGYRAWLERWDASDVEVRAALLVGLQEEEEAVLDRVVRGAEERIDFGSSGIPESVEPPSVDPEPTGLGAFMDSFADSFDPPGGEEVLVPKSSVVDPQPTGLAAFMDSFADSVDRPGGEQFLVPKSSFREGGNAASGIHGGRQQRVLSMVPDP